MLFRILDILLLTVTALVLLPVMVFTFQCLLGALPRRRLAISNGSRPAVAVLIPAHDEEVSIAATVTAIKAQSGPGDRILVVADNCSDATAAVARNAGAEVIERSDPNHRGKGFALDFGIRHLALNPPEVVCIIDADCRILDGAIDTLARLAVQHNRPVQGSYLLDPPHNPRLRDRISAFAFLVKNLARPMGLQRLGLPCLLMGTGMAFPWALIKDAPLASGNIVEDMQLGVDLAIAGHPPLLCPDVGVRGQLPAGRTALTQRRRWEHGHLQTQLTQLPRLLGQAIRQFRLDLLAMALDLTIPPLSLLLVVWAMVLAASGIAWAFGASRLPFLLTSAGGVLLAGSIFAVRARWASGILPLRSLIVAPFYALWKIPLYIGFLFRREKDWVRTQR